MVFPKPISKSFEIDLEFLKRSVARVKIGRTDSAVSNRHQIQLRSFLFLCVNPFLPNSVIADGELRLIDVIVETSAADVQLDADRCDIVCTDLVVLERALGNSVFHGTGIFQLQECRFDVSAANHPCCRTPTIPVPMQVSFQPILFSYNLLSVRPVPM